MKEKIYRNLDKELDKITPTEITARFREKQKKLSVWKVNDILEKLHKEFVHQGANVCREEFSFLIPCFLRFNAFLDCI